MPNEVGLNLPTEFHLGQNYPNPFNPTTTIRVALPEAAEWTLSVYDAAGRLVRRFDGSTGGATFVEVNWDGRDNHGMPVSSGMYLYRARAGGFTDVKKMLLLK